MTVMMLGVVLCGAVAALGCWLGYQLLCQNGRILLRLEALEQRLAQLSAAPSSTPESLRRPGLPVGAPAPEFELPDLSGTPVTLSQFRGRRLLLIFFNPRCGFCTRMAPDLAALPVDGADGRPLPLVVTTGDPEENRRLVQEHGIRCPVVIQAEKEVASRYQASGTPTGYLINEQGRIASELAVGAPALLAVAYGPTAPVNGRNGHAALGGTRPVTESRVNRCGLTVGTPAPYFRLPRLDGGELSLEEYRGRQVLLVFSDPHCGPCDALAPRLEQIHCRTAEIQILMVSRGDQAANRAKIEEHGLTFPVVLQRQWEISRQYAKFGTPVGYLIDEEGIIAADVAVGVAPILALATARPLRRTGGPR